jgi:signal transduction histidine kinase/CheY-like chemotaxis protein/PAS domain-containing protein
MTNFDRDTEIDFIECVHPEDVDLVAGVWTQLITTGDPSTFVFRIQIPPSSTAAITAPQQSEVRWALGNTRVDRDDFGSIVNITTCLTEITDQKRTANEAMYRAQLAEKLSAKLSRFQRMCELSTVGLFDCSRDGEIIHANDTFFNICCLPKEAPPNDPLYWKNCISDDQLDMVMSKWTDIYYHDIPFSIELKLKEPWIDETGGQRIKRERWIIATAMPVKGYDGKTESYTGCVTEIGVQKLREKTEAERADLLDLLLLRTEEAKTSDTRFKIFAEMAPIGIAIVSLEGRIIFRNKTWGAITRYPDDEDSPFSWEAHVMEDDRHIMWAGWARVLEEKVHSSYEIRLTHPWKIPGEVDKNKDAPTWISCSAFPELAEDGSVKAVMTCVTEISHFKWAEAIERQRTEEALESKRQQENFIDMTSHEVRNPVSAIIQCADSIISSLRHPLAGKDAIEDSIDSANIIISCAQHQKRIVDDILTLSKLDSKLLSITPVIVQPVNIVQDVFRMFEAEAQRAKVDMIFTTDNSLDNMQVNWLLLDPSRLTQVLINLLTNAIKFTEPSDSRQITVTMKIMLERPSASKEEAQGISYVTRSPGEDLTLRQEWGQEEPLFLQFAVQDTGRGMTCDEKKLLFKRFSQTSPRTHIQYGGSGLGLFISRQLTELQGGEIGVSSTAGVGSTFAFYVKTRRSNAPAANLVSSVPHSLSYPSIKNTGLSVLVVEDNVINAKVLCKQLRQVGYDVHVANHGGEALEFLKKTSHWNGQSAGLKLSIVLMDIEMPVMDGLSCVRKIRELQDNGDLVDYIPTIAVSANARSEQILMARDAGMVNPPPVTMIVSQILTTCRTM